MPVAAEVVEEEMVAVPEFFWVVVDEVGMVSMCFFPVMVVCSEGF